MCAFKRELECHFIFLNTKIRRNLMEKRIGTLSFYIKNIQLK